MEENQTSTKAWELLDEALFTSKHVKDRDIKAGSTDWENVYPTSLEETDKMDALMDEAEKEAGSQRDADFNERLAELRDITEWSRKRHKTWKWSLIAGALLSVAIFWYFNNDNEEDVKAAKEVVASVENWVECDTTITYKQVERNSYGDYQSYYRIRLRNAKWYKAYLLNKAKYEELSSLDRVKEYRLRADTATTDKRKEWYLKAAKDCEERAKEYRTMFDEQSKMGFEDIKKLALEDVGGTLKRHESSKSTTTGWIIYLVILIPLYIISGYAYGYMITRHRRQRSIMNTLQKWGYRAAVFFFGTGLAMNLLPDNIVKYQYSNGATSTEREANVMNIIVIALKVGLVVLGVIIFCFTAVFIMTIETITGLMRNFNWAPLINKAKGQAAKLGEKAAEQTGKLGKKD